MKKLRNEVGLSQIELAKLANISQAHVAKIENDKVDPRLSTVNRILIVLSKREKQTVCEEIMNKDIIFVKTETLVKKIMSVMRSSGISQIPVFEKGKLVGSIREMSLVKNMGRSLRDLRAEDIMEGPFPIVDAEDPVEMLPSLLEVHPAVLVSRRGKISGIIAKSDLIGMK
ncbi:MAG: CBS domain-containing protein [Candidatus Aenigmarchaeota archaeon]|nr:CBS domain-containing protein [Candidatus Aenigmarchaeota archaeon]